MSEYDDGPSGDTGGSTAVLEAPPASTSSSESSPADAGPTSSTETTDAARTPDPVPYERFKEVDEKYNKLKWAESYQDSARVQQQVALTEWLDRDPIGFYRYYQTQLQQMGYLPPETPPQQQAPQPPQMPPPDYRYRDEQGHVQSFYSADQLQKVLAFMEEKMAGRVAPIEHFLQSQAVQVRAQQEAQTILKDAETWPHFSDFKAEIWQAMQADRRLSLEGAYRKVVVPAIKDRERQSLLAELKQKPAATTTSPAHAQPQGSEDRSKLSITELFRREMRRRGMGS